MNKEFILNRIQELKEQRNYWFLIDEKKSENINNEIKELYKKLNEINIKEYNEQKEH